MITFEILLQLSGRKNFLDFEKRAPQQVPVVALCTINHLQVTTCLSFKTSQRAKPFL